ncbi:MAG: ATP-binding cassette domain-containing protein [Methanomicrobiaceae archaeon]|nr:ATP-binding cassette domain-containing protein [Methanomicrobiaceae archaeon]
MIDPASPAAALEVTHLAKSFDGEAILRDVSFSVGRGELLVLRGESGTGKSVLLKCITRLIEPDAGTVRIFGTDSTTLDGVEVRRRVLLVGQVPTLFEGTVRENLEYPFSFKSNQHLPPPDSLSLLAMVGLSADLLGRNAAPLSVGQQQRLCIARALALDPGILLFDEPTAALDPAAKGVVEETILRLNREQGRAILMVTHNVEQVRRMGVRTLTLTQGMVTETGGDAG